MHHNLGQPNELRVFYNPHSGPVEYFGIAINAGSRDEFVGEEGLAHFVEHTIFKGTRRRRPWHILNRMEAVGGELNAYTTKEETIIYTVFPRGNLNRAIDLIADLIENSVFPERELAREREVVAEEIDSYLDTPSEMVFDDFEDMLFAGSSLGHNILGSKETLSKFTTDDCLRWIRRNYTLSQIVAFYSGSTPYDRVERLCKSYFSGLIATDSDNQRIMPEELPSFNITRRCENHQAHTVIGARIPGLHSKLIRPMGLLVNILGGPGMNSLLNVELRERRGLVYSVDVSTSLFTDCGALEIYFGSNPEDVDKCSELTETIIQNLISGKILTPRKLEAAKKQFIGQLLIASQQRENSVMSFARQSLFGLPTLNLEQLSDEIKAITFDNIAMCLEYIKPDRLSRLTLS